MARWGGKIMDDKIIINKSPMADSRTCDVTKVTKMQLHEASGQHIHDVIQGMNYLARLIKRRGLNHDVTKIDELDLFYQNFREGSSGFAQKEWYQLHVTSERHHLKDHVHDDVNLIDVLEMIVDCVMAGLARTGTYRKDEIDPDVLVKAYHNTVQLLLDNVEVDDDE